MCVSYLKDVDPVLNSSEYRTCLGSRTQERAVPWAAGSTGGLCGSPGEGRTPVGPEASVINNYHQIHGRPLTPWCSYGETGTKRMRTVVPGKGGAGTQTMMRTVKSGFHDGTGWAQLRDSWDRRALQGKLKSQRSHQPALLQAGTSSGQSGAMKGRLGRSPWKMCLYVRCGPGVVWLWLSRASIRKQGCRQSRTEQAGTICLSLPLTMKTKEEWQLLLLHLPNVHISLPTDSSLEP